MRIRLVRSALGKVPEVQASIPHELAFQTPGSIGGHFDCADQSSSNRLDLGGRILLGPPGNSFRIGEARRTTSGAASPDRNGSGRNPVAAVGAAGDASGDAAKKRACGSEAR